MTSPDKSPGSLAQDTHIGLTKPFKEIPPKHLYDARGSALFEHICQLPEYYPTRTEVAILKTNAGQIIELTKPNELVELGSGATTKAELLLNAMYAFSKETPYSYRPVDVAKSMVEKAVDQLKERYPTLTLEAIVADFISHIEELPAAPRKRRLFALLGGTVGNLPPKQRHQFFKQIASIMQPNDFLLLGTDLVKDPATIEAAYNDQAGVTAAFNLNLLHVLNRELDADFDLDNFEHRAFYDHDHQWIEMRLRAKSACEVKIQALDLAVQFHCGEEIRTEISAKFTFQQLKEDLEQAGLALHHHFTDPDNLFGVNLIKRLELS